MRKIGLALATLLVFSLSASAEEPVAQKTAPTAEGSVAPTRRAQVMDINTASVDELKTLPGMTDETAGKIVQARPFKGKDQLLKQNLVDKEEYAKIRPMIRAKQPKAITTPPGATPAAAHTTTPAPPPSAEKPTAELPTK